MKGYVTLLTLSAVILATGCTHSPSTNTISDLQDPPSTLTELSGAMLTGDEEVKDGQAIVSEGDTTRTNDKVGNDTSVSGHTKTTETQGQVSSSGEQLHGPHDNYGLTDEELLVGPPGCPVEIDDLPPGSKVITIEEYDFCLVYPENLLVEQNDRDIVAKGILSGQFPYYIERLKVISGDSVICSAPIGLDCGPYGYVLGDTVIEYVDYLTSDRTLSGSSYTRFQGLNGKKYYEFRDGNNPYDLVLLDVVIDRDVLIRVGVEGAYGKEKSIEEILSRIGIIDY